MTVKLTEALADALMTDRDSLIKYIRQSEQLEAQITQSNDDLVRANNTIQNLQHRIDETELAEADIEKESE
jgi:ABC-type transporter Mla subunit MlaD